MSVEPPREYAEVTQLVNRYCAGEVSADDYYAAMDVYARRVVEEELRGMTARAEAAKPEPACPDHPGETAHNCRCCAADRKAVESA